MVIMKGRYRKIIKHVFMKVGETMFSVNFYKPLAGKT